MLFSIQAIFLPTADPFCVFMVTRPLSWVQVFSSAKKTNCLVSIFFLILVMYWSQAENGGWHPYDILAPGGAWWAETFVSS